MIHENLCLKTLSRLGLVLTWAVFKYLVSTNVGSVTIT